MTDETTSASTVTRFLQKGDRSLANYIARAVIGVSAVMTLAWLGMIIWFLAKLALQLL